MTNYIYYENKNGKETISMRSKEDSDVILTCSGKRLTAEEILKFLENNGIIRLTNEL